VSTRLDRLLYAPSTALAMCVAATAWVCAPMVRGDFRVGDTAFTLLWMRHLGHFGSWVDGPAARPMARSIAQNDWVLGEGLLLRSFEWLGPWNAHDAVTALGLLLTTIACQRLAAAALGEGPHTWIAAWIGGLNPTQTSHAVHANLVHHEWMVLGALLVAAGGVRGRPWLAFAGGLVAAGSFHFGLYVGIHSVLAFSLALLLCGRKTALAALGGALTMGLTVAPVLLTYHDAGQDWGAHVTLDERVRESWRFSNVLQAQPTALLHRWIATSKDISTNPGYVALAMGVFGLFRARGRAGVAVVLGVIVASLLALGPRVEIGSVRLPGLDTLLPLGETREPSRWLAVAFVGWGLLAAWGVATRHRIAALLALPIGLELAVIRTADSSLELPAIYAQIPKGDTVLYDAALVQQRSCGCGTIHALAGAWEHGHPLLGGVFARPTREGRELTRTAARWPESIADALFARADVRIAIEHPPLAPRERGECVLIEEHRMCTLPEWGEAR
jgi:hypothetical protein